MKEGGLFPGAEPFLYRGGRTGCLLVHGYASTPAEMRPLGRALNENGITAMGILLAGHGTAPKDMARTRWPDWYQSVERGVRELSMICARVFLIGLSMGGLLSLLTAAEGAVPVDGVISLNTPLELKNKKVKLLPIIKLYRRFEKSRQSPRRQRINAKYNRVVYDRHPLVCVESLLDLTREMQSRLCAVKCPALIVQSWSDRSVQPDSALGIYSGLGSDNKRLLRLDEADHIITLDEKNRDLLYNEIFIFIRTVDREK